MLSSEKEVGKERAVDCQREPSFYQEGGRKKGNYFRWKAFGQWEGVDER